MYMKEISKMELKMDMDKLNYQMEMSIKVNGS